MKTYKTERQKLVEQYQNLQNNDELLAAQAQYYKQKTERESKSEPPNEEEKKPTKPKSQFKQKRAQNAEQGHKPPKMRFKQSTLLIGDVLEKNTSNIGCEEDDDSMHNTPFIVTEKGFPSTIKHSAEEIAKNVKLHQHDSMWHHQQFFNIKHEQNTELPPKKKQKLSLFAQRMQSKTPHNQSNNQQINATHSDDNEAKQDDSHPMINMIRSLKIPPQRTTADNDPNVPFIKKLNMESNIVSENEIQKIGSENDTFLRQQSESEILEMRKELLATMDPKLIALLTGKKTVPSKPKQKTKRKVKISYDEDAEKKEDKTKCKGSVIRSVKPLKRKTGFVMQNKQNSTDWVHPAAEVRESFDASVDLNNDIAGPTQKEKMEWMEPLNVKQEQRKYATTDAAPLMIGDNPLAYYRFGFDGTVLCDNKGIIKAEDDMHLGLHHHGEEPLKPGYTVNELMHLCKSSAANQRNTAIQTLMHCIQKMRCGVYGMDYSEYLWILLQQNSLISLIVEILSMEKNVSCLIPILDLLHAVVVPMKTLFNATQNECFNAQTERLIWDGFHILCNTLPNITPVEMDTNQSLFKGKTSGQYETGSLKHHKEEKRNKNQMNDIWKCDVVLALVRKTKIIRYFNDILSKYIVPNIDGMQDTMYVQNLLPKLLDIIMTLVRHHPHVIDVIVTKNATLMQNLLAIVFCRQKEYAMYRCKVIDIVCIMCQMNKKTIEYLVRGDTLSEMKTFIVEGIDNPNDLHKLQLSISTLQLWRVCIKFGYDLNAFNDLLPKLMQLLTHFTITNDVGSIEKKVFALQQRQTRGLLNVIEILLQSLVPSNMVQLPSITTVSWNQIATLTEKAISLFDDAFNKDQTTQTDWLCIGGLCHVIATYFATLKQQNDDTLGQPLENLLNVAQRQCVVLSKKYIATWSRCKENKLLSNLLLNKRNWTYNNTQKDEKHSQFPLLDGLLADIALSSAVVPTEEYLSKCDCLLSVIRMVRSFVLLNGEIMAILVSAHFVNAIGRILLQITSKHFHFRLNRSLRGLLFNYWRIEFLLAFEILMLCDACKSPIATLNVTNMHSAACVLFECLPPGYMHCGDVLFNKFIVSTAYLGALKQLAIEHGSNKELCALSLKRLKDIYTKQDKYLHSVFNPYLIHLCDTTHSYSSCNSARIKSLCAVPCLVPTFWILQPLVNVYKHKIASRSITTLLHLFYILSACCCEEENHHYWCNIAVWDTYRSIATLYLCDSDVYCDALNRLLIYELVMHCWNRICCANEGSIYLCDDKDPSSACMIDDGIDSDMNVKSLRREWQAFYTKLVEQYECDSFGDELFAQVVLFQLQNKYNKQFRTCVWSSMDSLCVTFNNECPPNTHPEAWKSFFIPFEKDDTIIDLQFQSITKNTFNNLANYQKNSFLYLVAVVQVSHYIWNHKNAAKYHQNMLQNVFKQCQRSVIIDIINCNWDKVHKLHLDTRDNTQSVRQLKEWIEVGKDTIVSPHGHEYIKYRLSVMNNDFASVCQTLSLL